MKLSSRIILVISTSLSICFSLKSEGQIVKNDTLTVDTFKEHVSLIVSNKFIFNKLIQLNENKDSVIYFDLNSFHKLVQSNPYKIQNTKIYLWNDAYYFFYTIMRNHYIRIIDISHCWAWTYYEFMIYSKKAYYGNLRISNIRNQKKVPAYIEELEIYKLKKTKKN